MRVGVFGLLGSGNLGNDGSLEAVLGYLRAEHPEAVVDALCGGPEAVAARYGIPATRLHWYRGEYRTASRAGAIVGKGLGKLVDAFRTAAWVRRHDVVIVPGMGVLEATLPLRPWGFPYALFLLCACGRLLRTRVALVGVGAAEIRNRPTRALVRWSARLATYRSYRDAQSRDAMRAMGVDTARDEVYPDLAFALPTPRASEPSGPPGPVCVGVMDFHGGNDDRARAEEIHRRYLDGTIRFVRTLVEEGRPVRLLTGDPCDASVVAAILDAVDSPLVTAAEPASLADLMKEMAAADTVVAIRYHNLICALKTGTPVLALCYAAKSDALMDGMGLGAYCHPAREVDADRLLEQFRALEKRSAELRQTLTERNLAAARRLEHQFNSLTAALFPAADHAHTSREGSMKATEVPEIAGAYLFEPTPYADERGFFSRTFDADVVRSVGLDPDAFVQDSLSRSVRGVLRGLHLRSGAGEAKLVRCSYGRIFDVVVDLRPDSPTYRNRAFFELSGETQATLYIPAGCAHGFQALTETADTSYRIDRPHDPAEDVTIAFDDPELAIPWPLPVTSMSQRDREAPSLAEVLKHKES